MAGIRRDVKVTGRLLTTELHDTCKLALLLRIIDDRISYKGINKHFQLKPFSDEDRVL